jgi:hypothetical protein
MNRSSRKAHPVNTHGLLSHARRLLHAFAGAGEPSAAGLQLFVGPNGGLMWIDSVQVDRSEPYAGDVFSNPQKAAAPVDRRSPVTVPPKERAKTPVYERVLPLL